MNQTSFKNLGDSLRLCLALQKAQANLSRRFDGRLGTWHGLGFGDFALLLHLSTSPDGQLRRVDLATELGLTASAVTRMLIPLEKIGLVTRQRDARDARVGYATLTAAGRRVLKEALDSAEEISQDLIPADAASELSDLVPVLARL